VAQFRVTVFSGQAIREAAQASTEKRVQIAHEIAHDAIASAPVLTGEYRSGISVEVNGDTVRVVDNDPDAGFKEYGTVDTPAHATLTDAARKRGKYSGVQPRGR
jgi:hypothetical protein